MYADRRTCVRTEQAYRCKVHPKGWLVTVWDPKANGYAVICRDCHRLGDLVDHFERRKSLIAQWIEDPESVPVHVANRLAKEYHDDVERSIEGLPDDVRKAIREKYGIESSAPERGEKGVSNANQESNRSSSDRLPAHREVEEGRRESQ